MKNYKYNILGIDCANCANELEDKLNKIKGIDKLNINFMTQKLTFQCEEDELENILKEIKKTIKKHEPDAFVEEL